MTRRSNPWLKKNPLLSIWLSTANAMMGAARGQAAAAVARSAGAAALKPERKTTAARRKPAAGQRP
ncbi:MAG: hypothetical protein KDF67_03505 [Ottowia sp.]|nr:hypothetical protein [Halioglobus sp.]MCB2068752.1 hypothetical protein [Ottowia sp.]